MQRYKFIIYDHLESSHATIFPGTAGYVDWLVENPLEASFPEIRIHSRVFEAWHRKLMKRGDKNGYPRKRPNEKHPNGLIFKPYKMTSVDTRLRENFVSPKSTNGHPKLFPIRGVSHTFAIMSMLCNGLFLCIVTKDAAGNNRLMPRLQNVSCDNH